MTLKTVSNTFLVNNGVVFSNKQRKRDTSTQNEAEASGTVVLTQVCADAGIECQMKRF